MAILKSVVDVNNGNTGWTKSDVMDALETVFANLGWHGGSASTGVPQALTSPTGATGSSDTWRTTGGAAVVGNTKTHYYTATATGTSAYRMIKLVPSSGYQYWYSNTGTGKAVYEVNISTNSKQTELPNVPDIAELL